MSNPLDAESDRYLALLNRANANARPKKGARFQSGQWWRRDQRLKVWRNNRQLQLAQRAAAAIPDWRTRVVIDEETDR